MAGNVLLIIALAILALMGLGVVPDRLSGLAGLAVSVCMVMMIMIGPPSGEWQELPPGVKVCGVIYPLLLAGQLMELPGFEHPLVRFVKGVCGLVVIITLVRRRSFRPIRPANATRPNP